MEIGARSGASRKRLVSAERSERATEGSRERSGARASLFPTNAVARTSSVVQNVCMLQHNFALKYVFKRIYELKI